MIVQFRLFFLCNAGLPCIIIRENGTYFNCESMPAHPSCLTLKIFVAHIVRLGLNLSLPCLYLLILTCKYPIISIFLKPLEIKRVEYCEHKINIFSLSVNLALYSFVFDDKSCWALLAFYFCFINLCFVYTISGL